MLTDRLLPAFAPVLLERKANAIRKELATDSEKTGGIPRIVKTRFEVDRGDRRWQEILLGALIRPFKLWISEPIVQLLGIYMAFVYGVMYLFLTTIPGIFTGVYGEEVGISGLNYIASGIGMTMAAQINARLMDKIYVYFKNKNCGKGEPEFRLRALCRSYTFVCGVLTLINNSIDGSGHYLAPNRSFHLWMDC